MNKDHARVLFVLGFAILVFASAGAPASAQDGQRGFYFGAFYTGFHTPTFRMPSGGEELAVPQSASAPGFMSGFQYDSGKIGMGARIVYWRASFKSFGSPQMPGSPTYVRYANPAFTHVTLDLLLEWIALAKPRVGAYGLLGLASSTESYLISGSDFPDWNGQKSLTEFDYSYGLGVRFSPLKPITVLGEIRWIPGDRTSELEFSHSEGGWDYYRVTNTYTANFTTIVSAGLSFHF